MLKLVLLGLCFIYGNIAFSSTKILILGDSLAEGLGVQETQSFPAVSQKIFRLKNRDIEIVNGGISGSTSASGVSRLKWHLQDRFDLVILELGANDGLRGIKIDETEKNLVSAVEFLKSKKIKTLMLGILLPPNYGKEYTQKFKKMYEGISKKNKIPLYPFILEGVAGNKELNQDDGIHPNAKGHEIIAKNLVKFIEQNI